MTDDELLDRFERAELDAEAFGHAAHVRVAWLQLSRLPLLQAIGEHTAALCRLTARLGVPQRYHATLTVAYLLLIYERMAGEDTWEAFAANHPDLLAQGARLLSVHYDDAQLKSEAARQAFIPPVRDHAVYRIPLTAKKT